MVGRERILRPPCSQLPVPVVRRRVCGAANAYEPAGLCRNELRDRMLTRMPDVTRLLDRMEEAGLVARSRDNEDRRLVSTRITDAGRKVVDGLDAPVHEFHKRRMAHVSDEQLRTLINLLTLARDRG